MTDDDRWLALHAAPGSTALLVIDVQNDFCARGGWYSRIGYDLGTVDRSVQNINELVLLARRFGILVVFVRCIYGPGYVSPRMLEAWQHKGLPTDACVDGTWGAEFFRVTPGPGDVVLSKHRYSAFVHTELQSVLLARRVENLLLCGVATNICVESTARDASMLDYRVTVVGDCCASYNQALHDAALENVGRAFGVVASLAELSRILFSEAHSG